MENKEFDSIKIGLASPYGTVMTFHRHIHSSQVCDCFSLHTCPHFGLHRQLHLPVQWKHEQRENILL